MPLKNDEKCFLFHIKNSFCSWDIYIFVLTFWLCRKKLSLRCYATFKMRKLESLFYKINNFLQKTTTCIGLQAEQIFSIKIWYTYFSNFGHGFCVPFPYYSQNLQPPVVKKIWNSLCSIVLLFVWAQKLCLRFLKSYFKLEVLIFLSFVVPFLVDMFN